LPAGKHVGTPGAVEDNLARLLDGANPCPPGKQSAGCQEGNQ